jgi:phage terminase small subunit
MESATREGVLNSKQLRFIDEYLIDFNASQAAIRAGYSKKTAGSIGFNLLKKAEIQQAIKAKQRELANKAGITRERIVAEVARIAFADVRRLFKSDGTLKPVQEIDDDTAGALAGVDVVETGGEMPVITKKVKLWDKNSALEKLLKHLGMDDGAPPPEQAAGVTVKLDFEAVRKKIEAPR